MPSTPASQTDKAEDEVICKAAGWPSVNTSIKHNKLNVFHVPEAALERKNEMQILRT